MFVESFTMKHPTCNVPLMKRTKRAWLARTHVAQAMILISTCIEEQVLISVVKKRLWLRAWRASKGSHVWSLRFPLMWDCLDAQLLLPTLRPLLSHLLFAAGTNAGLCLWEELASGLLGSAVKGTQAQSCFVSPGMSTTLALLKVSPLAILWFIEEMSIPLKELIERHAGGVRGGWDNLLGNLSSCILSLS